MTDIRTLHLESWTVDVPHIHEAAQDVGIQLSIGIGLSPDMIIEVMQGKAIMLKTNVHSAEGEAIGFIIMLNTTTKGIAS